MIKTLSGLLLLLLPFPSHAGEFKDRLESRQDPLNFPIRLNDELPGVMGVAVLGDHPPTASAVAVRDEAVAAYDALADRIGLPAVGEEPAP